MAERAVTRELARFIVGLKYDDLPKETIRFAKEAVLDQLGIMLMGSTLAWTRPAYEVVCDSGGKPESTVVGHGTKIPALDAAFANANFGHSCELDDSGHTGTQGHPGSLTVAPALALAERSRLGGKDVLLAVIAGYEILARLGRVMRPGDYGFHAQSVSGTFAAATVAGKLLGLDAERMLHALSIAGSHSSGTHEYDQTGGEVKRVHASIAVRGGMMSALLAQRGLTGPPTILEGEHGICRVFGRVTDAQAIEKILESFKDNWYAIQGRIVKLFPTDGGIHTSFQALSRLMHEGHFGHDEVAEIHLRVNKSFLSHVGSIEEPTDTLSAQYCMAFSMGLRLVKGRNELRDYMDPGLWKDPRVMAAGSKVHLHADPDMTGDKRYGVRMQVKLKDGRAFATEELYRKGSAQNPLTRGEFVEKFQGLAAAVLNDGAISGLIDTIDHLDEVDDISRVMPLAIKP